MKWTLLLVLFLPLFASAEVNSPKTEAKTETGKQPNILLVLLDDVGFMGLGSYGSDAQTPNIDSIAQQGVQFSRFYTAALCGPSRAMLMTGQDSHAVGMSTLVEALKPEMADMPAYSMQWQDSQQTLATRLKAVGYQTFVSGKWGIGRVGKNLPHRFGFDKSFVLDATGASNYQEKPYLSIYKEVKWFEDGKRVHLPEDFYSSRDLVNKMIGYLDNADPNKPFFAYLPLQAIHIPIQAPVEYIDKYNGVFDAGWDKKRLERLQTAIDLGLVPANTQLAAVPELHRKWDELSEQDKKFWSRMMQLNAGMLDAADHHIGRLLSHIESLGQLDNTIVVVTSDNGAEFNSMGHSNHARKYLDRTWMATAGWNTDYESLGQMNSMGAIGPEWADVSTGPLSLYKFNAAEGGLRVPLIIAGPGIKPLGIQHGRAHVADIVPTLLQQAGAEYQDEAFYGRSLVPVLTGEVTDVWQQDSFAFEVSGNAALYQGKWKLVQVKKPLGNEQWSLYDIENDAAELNNLANSHPVILQNLLNEYKSYSNEMGILTLAPGDYALKQVIINSMKQWVKSNWYIPLIILLLLGWGIDKFRKHHRIS
ncbi:arylsulfatase [Paraferrimonas sp. SM1919]|uniref:arylsulfatase n=1 Tax=Paraferrimonas sp. SM1919 TaxID=2662263 RepID=UPI0013D44D35|nr:arylsulfatase [Paraferrimonas sp. SM1919]